MVYFRGSKRDFDQWGKELGLRGWSYKEVLPYFKKFENNIDVTDTKVHGHSGKKKKKKRSGERRRREIEKGGEPIGKRRIRGRSRKGESVFFGFSFSSLRSHQHHRCKDPFPLSGNRRVHRRCDPLRLAEDRRRKQPRNHLWRKR